MGTFKRHFYSILSFYKHLAIPITHKLKRKIENTAQTPSFQKQKRKKREKKQQTQKTQRRRRRKRKKKNQKNRGIFLRKFKEIRNKGFVG